jgi:hypothetical protein
MGIEGRETSPSVPRSVDISDEERDRELDSRGLKGTATVARLATALEAAIRAGEVDRALELVAELRALEEPRRLRIMK